MVLQHDENKETTKISDPDQSAWIAQVDKGHCYLRID